MRTHKKDRSSSGRKPYATPRLMSHGGVQKLTHSTKGGSGLPGLGSGNHPSGGGGSQSPAGGTHGWNYYTRG